MKIHVFVILIIIAVLGNYVTDGRRGGGGFRGGSRSRGTRSGGSKSSGTVRSTTRFATRSSYRGSSYRQGTWKTAAAVGTLYGLSSYKQRRRYFDSPDSEPQVCFNEKNLRNGTFGYFICPEEGQSDDMAYCCGDEDAQTCCEYADAAERIVGIIIGVSTATVIVGVVVYHFCIKQRKVAQRKNTTMYSQNQSTGTASVQYSTSQPYSTSQQDGTSQPYSTGVDFQYGQKQGMNSYPQTADGPNTYDTIGNPAVNGALPYSSGPIGFEGEKSSQTQNNTAVPPPYPTTPYTGFQDVPTVPPPAYTTNNI